MFSHSLKNPKRVKKQATTKKGFIERSIDSMPLPIVVAVAICMYGVSKPKNKQDPKY